ncbi:phage tail fiber protein [Actinomadura nitritigenes]|uniref:phage tail fiber protein n=1 Tax=Actinomadura nitritigenes TaxID=134602 RepID=UPI003D8C5DA3
MSFVEAIENAMLELIDGSGAFPVTHLSMHVGDPGTTGANEVAGGSYVRQAITWAPASGGQKLINEIPVFNIPGGVTISHFGLWNAATGGAFRGGEELDAPQIFASPGTYTFDSLTAIA